MLIVISFPSEVCGVLAPLFCFPLEDMVHVGVRAQPFFSAFDELEYTCVLLRSFDGCLGMTVSHPCNRCARIRIDREYNVVLLAVRKSMYDRKKLTQVIRTVLVRAHAKELRFGLGIHTTILHHPGGHVACCINGDTWEYNAASIKGRFA